MTPEEKARQAIDRQLEAAGWVIQDMAEFDRYASLGVAVREFSLQSGEADYLLFVDGRAVGVLEAKPQGTTLSGVAEQTKKYLEGLPPHVAHHHNPLPFGYESTGVETYFLDRRDPEPRSRRVFSIHRPETLLEWVRQPDTLRSRLQQMPPLPTANLRDCQVEAVQGLEASLAQNRPRALIQMATGSGKTFTAVTACYRLIKFAGAKRILFLVDRKNLGKQTLGEFQQYVTPDDGRKFGELYNVQLLSGTRIDPVAKVTIGTIQRLYSMLRGEELEEEAEEVSLNELNLQNQRPKEVAYNPDIPPETFDFIITDECHRSIYNLWRQVLEYFDSFLIGLTATPSKQTLGFFNQNLVTEYSFDRAVADNVNVDYDVYRIKTQVAEQGAKVEAGQYVDKRDKLSRSRRWEALDDDLEYRPNELDRSVVATDQIRTIIRTFKEKLFTELFPGRTHVPKTLIFAKDDSHAEDIVEIVREEFGKGNEFCKKITYRTTEDPETLIKEFRNSYNPRIAVTVDMISTGTDIKPLECLLFMRDVKSQVYFEQMKGRGTRTIDPSDLQAVTPDARTKTHFVLVDAIGVTESDKTDSRPLERSPSVPFKKLIERVMVGDRSPDTLSSLASRLSRLERQLDPKSRQSFQEETGHTLPDLANRLLDALDPDKAEELARATTGQAEPPPEAIQQARETLTEAACRPFNGKLKDALVSLQQQTEQVIDTVTKDQVTYAGYDFEKATRLVQSWREFIEAHKDELTALQILYSRPYGQRRLTFEAIQQLAQAVERPPYHLTPEALWNAYERLEEGRVRRAGPKRLLTDLVALVRFATGQAEVLEPFALTVEERFKDWLERQQASGRQFTEEQMEWLTMIRDHIAASAAITVQDLELSPFSQRGGQYRAVMLFPNVKGLLDELNEVLAA